MDVLGSPDSSSKLKMFIRPYFSMCGLASLLPKMIQIFYIKDTIYQFGMNKMHKL